MHKQTIYSDCLWLSTKILYFIFMSSASRGDRTPLYIWIYCFRMEFAFCEYFFFFLYFSFFLVRHIRLDHESFGKNFSLRSVLFLIYLWEWSMVCMCVCVSVSFVCFVIHFINFRVRVSDVCSVCVCGTLLPDIRAHLVRWRYFASAICDLRYIFHVRFYTFADSLRTNIYRKI